jgi:hypothetical protein
MVMALGTSLIGVSLIDADEKLLDRGSELAVEPAVELVVLECALVDVLGGFAWHAAVARSATATTPNQTRRTSRG